jgi:hypothetical protein
VLARSSAFPHPDREPKKVELLLKGIDDFGLCLIQGEFQPPKDLPQHDHGLAGFSFPAKQDNVVSVSDDAGSQSLLQIIPLPDPVQYVQVEIG